LRGREHPYNHSVVPILTFDLETIPDVDALRQLRPQWAALDDRAVAANAMAERRERAGNDFLPLHLHRVLVIGCAFRDESGFRVRSLGAPEDGEVKLIGDFFRLIDRYGPQLVSWNGSAFDLPVLHYRSLIHGIPGRRYWDQGDEDRELRFSNYVNRYHLRHVDLMDVLSRYQARAAAPLDEVARLCGFAGKLGMDGSQVWEAYCDGGIERIRAYCETDVVNTYLLYCRFRRIRGQLDEPDYGAELQLVRETLAASSGPIWQEFLNAWPTAPG
jgi:predicted PolB exonuclease-like 3'-5' exonuclease